MSDRRRLWGDLINVYKHPKEELKEDRDRLFSVVLRDRTRSNEHKQKYRNFH